MNLIVDIGNTRTKAALFKDDEMLEFKWFNSTNELLADTSFIKKAHYAIIGTVVNDAENFCGFLNSIIPTILFTSESRIPLKNGYQSVATLGSDRLAASVGAYTLFPSQSVLVIDAGTCIKYNFTNAFNEYLGGGISPGLTMRFRALHEFTGKLPLISINYNYTNLIGNSTQDSILSGVLNGCIAEIDGIISFYKEQYPNLICVITGGDSEYLAKRLKSTIFAHQNLVLNGLNHILNSTPYSE